MCSSKEASIIEKSIVYRLIVYNILTFIHQLGISKKNAMEGRKIKKSHRNIYIFSICILKKY